MRLFAIAFLTVAFALGTSLEARQKNHKRQTVIVQNMKIDVQRVDNHKQGRRVFPHVVFLSFKADTFGRNTGQLRLDTTGASVIRQITGCTPLNGIIRPGATLTHQMAYAVIEVTCP